MDISIIIPTYKNRTKYLRRSLDFYNRINFNGNILIGDSSEDEVLNNNIKLIDEFNDLKITHIHYPLEKYPHDGFISNDIIKYVNTDFVCFSGDDDFQISSTLETCINFLKYNTGYVGAHGTKIKYKLDYNKIHGVRIFKGQYLDIDDPIIRFRGYMKTCTSPQYHVTRKEVWEKIYGYINRLDNIKFLAAEVLPSSLYYILGKVKRFDNLIQYFMEETADVHQVQNPDYIINGINSDGWGRCSTEIRNIIVETLIAQGVDKDKAERAFDEEFNFRIMSHLHDQFVAMYKDSFEDFTKKYYDFTEQHDKEDLPESVLKESMQIIIPSIVEYLKTGM